MNLVEKKRVTSKQRNKVGETRYNPVSDTISDGEILKSCALLLTQKLLNKIESCRNFAKKE